MKKKILIICSFILILVFSMSVFAVPIKVINISTNVMAWEWADIDKRWTMSYIEDGELKRGLTGFVIITKNADDSDNEKEKLVGTYYLDSHSYMQTGWQKIDGKIYYFDETKTDNKGKMLHDTTRVINGKTYKFGSDGTLENTKTVIAGDTIIEGNATNAKDINSASAESLMDELLKPVEGGGKQSLFLDDNSPAGMAGYNQSLLPGSISIKY